VTSTTIEAAPSAIVGRKKVGIFSDISLDSFPHHHPQLSIDTWLMVSNHLQHRIESSSAPLPEHPGEWM